MRIISTSYNKTDSFDNPQDWLSRISFYTGVLEELAREHEVTSIERIDHEGRYIRNNVRYVFMKLKKNVVRFPFRMHRMIKKSSPDVVFINGFIFPFQVIQLRLTLGRKVRILILHRAEKPFSGLKKMVQRLADKCVDAYLFTSAEAGGEWIEKGIIGSPGKIREIIQGSSSFSPADKTVSRSSLAIAGSPLFIWAGRLNENKDPLTIVRAFLHYSLVVPTAKLYMVFQSGELLPEINEMLHSNEGAFDKIKLVGSIPHRQMQDWYNAADFILSGSYSEGSGIAVSEAMSCGCIPVVTDIASFRRMTGPGRCGFLFKPGDSNGLLETLIQAGKSDIEKERARALDQFQRELSFEAIARKINKLITSPQNDPVS